MLQAKNNRIFAKIVFIFKKKSAINIVLVQNFAKLDQNWTKKAEFYHFLILTGQNWSNLSG